MRFHQRAGAALLAAGLLVPAGAAVATSANAATPIAAHQGHGKAKAKKVACFKDAKVIFRSKKMVFKKARGTKRGAYRRARIQWLKDTAPERAVRRAALAVASTDEQRKAARTTFRTTTTQERAELRATKKLARTKFRSARKDFRKARIEFRGDKRVCRTSR